MNKILAYVFRNSYTMNDSKASAGINIEWWNKKDNVGDSLAPVIVGWMLSQKEKKDPATKKKIHLMTVGSILGMGHAHFDAIVWGSGVNTFKGFSKIYKDRLFRKFDIRVVRGPVTRNILRTCGYDCPESYGDPAVLLPLIYPINSLGKKDIIGFIPHILNSQGEMVCDDLLVGEEHLRLIDVRTSDYRNVINQICKCKVVISSSLHGIILAEAYGIPAIFLQDGMDWELIKYYDWYYSTGRKEIKFAYSLEEAIKMRPMELPNNISELQNNLLNRFPYEMWE